MSAPEQVQVDRAIELWFFRDISDEQRRALIGLVLGQAVAGEATNHAWQRLCLKRILRHTAQSDALAAMREAQKVLQKIDRMNDHPGWFRRELDEAVMPTLAKLTAAIDQMGGG